MHRFFMPPASLNQDEVILPQEVSRQIARVLRLEPGSQIIVVDGCGNEFLVELEKVKPDEVTGRKIEKRISQGEPQTSVHMYLALTQRERFEWMLQKCTEVGVRSFTPLVTSRSLVQKIAEVEGKYLRWNKIIQEAAEQSHRGMIPSLFAPLLFSDFMRRPLEPGETGLFLWEEEADTDIKKVLQTRSSKKVNLVIGPEGGFTSEEAREAMKAGYTSASLGKRILRVETAAIVAAALVVYELG